MAFALSLRCLLWIKHFWSDLTLTETDSLSIAFAVSTSFYWLVFTYFLFDLFDAWRQCSHFSALLLNMVKRLFSMKAVFNDNILAESNDIVYVDGNPYFPREAIYDQYFRDSRYTTVCGWKVGRVRRATGTWLLMIRLLPMWLGAMRHQSLTQKPSVIGLLSILERALSYLDGFELHLFLARNGGP